MPGHLENGRPRLRIARLREDEESAAGDAGIRLEGYAPQHGNRLLGVGVNQAAKRLHAQVGVGRHGLGNP